LTQVILDSIVTYDVQMGRDPEEIKAAEIHPMMYA